MSQFVSSAPVPVGATKPIQPGGILSYKNETKPKAFANQRVQATYGFKTYNTLPPYLGERSGHYSVVVDQPDDVRLGAPGLEDVFEPANPEMVELTDYYLTRLPSEQKNLSAIRTIQQHGLQDLLTMYLRKKLQDDAEEVKARYAGATTVEAELASARLQNRFSDMIRYYGSEQKLREALLRDVVGGQPDAALRAVAGAAIQREMAEGGAGAFPVDAGAPAGAMPRMGGDVGAVGADAEDIMQAETNKTEAEAFRRLEEAGEPLPSPFAIKSRITQLDQRLAVLNTEEEQLNEDIDVVSSEEEVQRIAARLEEIAEERANLIEARDAMVLDMRASAPGRGAAAADEAADTGYLMDDDAPAEYAPGGSAASQYAPIPMVGGGGGLGAGPAFSEPRMPTTSTARPLVGEIIGQQSAAAPASARATKDLGAAGTAREEQYRRMARRAARKEHKAEMKRSLERAIMGMELTGADEPVEVRQQEASGQHDRRSSGSRPEQPPAAAAAPAAAEPAPPRGFFRGTPARRRRR